MRCRETPTHNIESEADEAVVVRQGKENFVHEQNVLKVVDHTFSVQEVHGSREKIPAQRLGETQVGLLFPLVLLLFLASNRNDFLERDELNGSDQKDNVDVTGEQGDEETSNHDKSPYRSGNEGLLLLFVGGLFGFLMERATVNQRSTRSPDTDFSTHLGFDRLGHTVHFLQRRIAGFGMPTRMLLGLVVFRHLDTHGLDGDFWGGRKGKGERGREGGKSNNRRGVRWEL